jgi:hypothetical protein
MLVEADQCRSLEALDIEGTMGDLVIMDAGRREGEEGEVDSEEGLVEEVGLMMVW